MTLMMNYATVNLRSKGPARKENSPLKDIDFGPDKIFFSFRYIAYNRILVYKKNLSGPMKSPRAKFNCTYQRQTIFRLTH